MDFTKVLDPIVFEGEGIRRTTEGDVSVFDLIGIVGGQSNPRKDWERLSNRYPEVMHKCYYFKFPGRGQRETPVASQEVALEILGLVNGSSKLPTEQDLENWFASKNPGCQRQVILPSGSRVDVILSDGAVCELKMGKADGKALKQLARYMSEMKAQRGFLVAQSFTPEVLLEIQLFNQSGKSIEACTCDDFLVSTEDNFIAHSSEYRELAAKLVLAWHKAPADLAIAAIDRVDNAEDSKRILEKAAEKYITTYHPLFGELRDRSNGDKWTYINVNKLNTQVVLGSTPKEIVLQRGGENARSNLDAGEYGKFSVLQDVQCSAIRKADTQGSKQTYAIAKEVAQDFEAFLSKHC